MWRRPACQTLSKALDILSATAGVTSDLLKALPTVRRSCSWLRTPKTIREIRKTATFLQLVNNPIIYTFSKNFTNHRKKTNRAVAVGTFPQHSWIQGPPIKPSNNLENKTTSDTYWRVQLVRKKVQACSSSELSLEYNQVQKSLTNQGSWWPFLTIMGVIEILISFRLVLKGKRCKEITESSRLELLEKVFSKQFSMIRCRR